MGSTHLICRWDTLQPRGVGRYSLTIYYTECTRALLGATARCKVSQKEDAGAWTPERQRSRIERRRRKRRSGALAERREGPRTAPEWMNGGSDSGHAGRISAKFHENIETF